MKKTRKYLTIMILFVQFFSIFPMTTFALTTEALETKNELITEYYNVQADIDSTLDDVLDFVTTYEEELSDAISIELIGYFIDDFNDRNIESFIDHVIGAFPEGSTLVTDLKVLKPDIKALYDKLNIYRDKALQFMKSEQYNLTVKDVASPINDSVAISMKSLKVADKIEQIVRGSVLGDLDIVALLEEEFSSEVNRIKTKVNELIDNQALLLIDRLNRIKGNNTLTTNQKIDGMVAIIDYIENVESKGLTTFATAKGELTATEVLQYLNESKTFFQTEMTDAIILAKKYLVDEMRVAPITGDLGTEDAINNYIVPVYGVLVTPSQGVVLAPSSRYLVSYVPLNSTNQLTNVISTNNGNINYQNLVSGRIATGSTLVVNNGTENILTYTFIIKGDLLGRAQSNTTDLFRLIDGALGKNPLTGIYKNAGDMNDDSKNDISDIIKLIDHILGK